MKSTSSRWADGIASSHELAVEVSLDGELLPVDGGSVTLDITAATYARADLRFSDASLVPQSPDDTLAPYDNELAIRRGLVYADGERELVQLGLLRVEEVEIAGGEDLGMNVSLLDRSNRVSEAKYDQDFEFAAGADYLGVILLIVGGSGVPTTADFPDIGGKVIPTLNAAEGDDRWTQVQNLAAAIGMDIYFDATGTLVLRPVPDIASDPVAYLVEGESGLTVKPTLLDLTKRWSRTDTYNRWVAIGENPNEEGAPPRGVAEDDDPDSPTYIPRFGFKPAEPYTSSDITTAEQAQDAAEGLKRRNLGTAFSLDFGALVNPALEPGDVVHITRTRRDPQNLDRVVEIANERHIIDSLTIPLDAAGVMTGTTRAIRVTS